MARTRAREVDGRSPVAWGVVLVVVGSYATRHFLSFSLPLGARVTWSRARAEFLNLTGKW